MNEPVTKEQALQQALQMALKFLEWYNSSTIFPCPEVIEVVRKALSITEKENAL